MMANVLYVKIECRLYIIIKFLVSCIFEILSVFSGHIPKKAGTEESELGFYRKKLIEFLQGSTYYRPEELLPRFPMNGERKFAR